MPRPAPLVEVPRWKSFRRMPAGMPGPVSSTHSSRLSAPSRMLTEMDLSTRRDWFRASMAFSIRLPSTVT